MTVHRTPIPLSVGPRFLPHEPDLAELHKLAVLAAVRWAWNELARTNPNILVEGTEDQITEKIEILLNKRENGHRVAYWLEEFETVTRGASQTAADGLKLNKKPDLIFRPIPYRSVSNPTHWGWFIECKIVNGPASVTKYRDEGVSRFWLGEYAPRMKSGAMFGYVRDGSTPISTLDAALNGVMGTQWHRPGSGPDESQSHHDRSAIAQPCVSITLTHVWLSTK